MAKRIIQEILVTDYGSSNKVLNSQKQINNELRETSKLMKTAYRRAGVAGEGEDYRASRGIQGATGAAGRDFSRQAQGLGGLVHVYATFAANIFAVVSAYQALDKVATFDRLTKAAETMSNRTGISMKNLGKDIQEVTGYAVTLEEALQFGAMGASAGLTGKQITNLTQIAKGAANALGRDVNDATRRIIQGTAKQEQEILDELGIFVKAQKAYDEYAKARNMKADDLSATQRVNAYAEAVAKAGDKWKEYAAIPDPFANLTSTIKAGGIELLGVINKVLTPIITLLGESKTLVEGILLLIVAKLGKMAMPHIGEHISNLFKVDPKVLEDFKKAQAVVTEGFNKQISAQKAKIASGKAEILSVLPNIDKRSMTATTQATAYAAIQKNIIASIKTQDDLEAAKEARLVSSRSTLSRINVLQTTSTKLAEKLVLSRKEELVALERIKDLEASREAQASEVHKSQKGTRWDKDAAANRQLVSDKYSTIIGDIGSGDIGLKDKFSSIRSNLVAMVSEASTPMGKFTNMFRMLGVVGSLAMRGIMAALGPLMLAFTAWEVIISPVLYKVGVFSEEADKLKESSTRLADQVKSSTGGWKNASDSLKEYSISVKQLDTIYGTIVSSATALQDSLVEQEKAYKALLVAKKGYIAGDEEIKLSQKSISALLASGFIKEGSKQYSDLLDASIRLQGAQIRGNNQNYALTESFKAQNKAISEAVLAAEAYKKSLSDITSPAEKAVTSIETLLKKRRESLDPNIKGYINPEAQSAYKSTIEGAYQFSAKTNLDVTGLSTAGSANIDQFATAISSLKKERAEEYLRKFGNAYTSLMQAKLNDPKAMVGILKEISKVSNEAFKEVDKQVPAPGTDNRLSRLDYELRLLKQKKDTITAINRESGSIDNISKISELELAINAKEQKIRDLRIRLDKAIYNPAGQTALSAEQKAQADIETESRRKKLAASQIQEDAKNLYENEKARIDLVKGTSNTLDAITASYTAQVALLETTVGLEGQSLELAKKKAKEEKDAAILKAQLGTSASELYVSGGKGAGTIIEAGLAASSKEIAAKAKGPLQGTVDAFVAGTDSAMTTLMDQVQKGAGITAKAVSDSFRNAASDIFKQMAIEQAKLAMQGAAKSGIGFIASLFSSSPISGSPGLPSGANAVALANNATFANGGIMTSAGPAALRKYASGGIASSPQVAIYGEGSMNEAFVPLPDGKSIPVSMKSPSTGQIINSGKTDINITIDNSGNAQTSSNSSNTADPAAFSKHIANIVKQEMVLQKAPGGMLYAGGR